MNLNAYCIILRIFRTLERKQEAVATAFNFEAVLCSEVCVWSENQFAHFKKWNYSKIL